MARLSFNESLLHLRGVSVESAGVLLVMYQNADPTGAISATLDEMRLAYGRTFTKRISTAKLKDAREELVRARLVPSLTSVHPPGVGEVDAEQQQRVQHVLETLESDLSGVRPAERPDHERIFAALVAFNAIEVAAKSRRQTLETEHDGPLVMGGRRYHYAHFEWDYALIQQWIKAHKLEYVLQTLASVYLSGSLEKVQHDGTLRDKRAKLLAYITGALAGRAPTTKDRFAHVRTDLAGLD